MIADITVTEKSFGPKLLMSGIKFSIDDADKVGVIGYRCWIAGKYVCTYLPAFLCICMVYELY